MSKTKIMKDLRHPGIENRNKFSLRRSQWRPKAELGHYTIGLAVLPEPAAVMDLDGNLGEYCWLRGKKGCQQMLEGGGRVGVVKI